MSAEKVKVIWCCVKVKLTKVTLSVDDVNIDEVLRQCPVVRRKPLQTSMA